MQAEVEAKCCVFAGSPDAGMRFQGIQKEGSMASTGVGACWGPQHYTLHGAPDSNSVQNLALSLAFLSGWPGLVDADCTIRSAEKALKTAMRELLLNSTCCWTGAVAAWAPFPEQTQQQAGHCLPPLRTRSRGVWLRSDGSGVVIVQWHSNAPPVLSCTLGRNVELFRAPLQPGSFAFRLLCPQHGGGAEGDAGGCGHLLFVTLSLPCSSEGGAQRTRSFAVHFDTMQAGRECGALLQAVYSGRLRADQLQPAALQGSEDHGRNLAATGQAWMQLGEEQHARLLDEQSGRDVVQPGKSSRADLFGFVDQESLMAALRASDVLAAGSLGVGTCALAFDSLHCASFVPFRRHWRTLRSTDTSSSWGGPWRRLRRRWPKAWRELACSSRTCLVDQL